MTNKKSTNLWTIVLAVLASVSAPALAATDAFKITVTSYGTVLGVDSPQVVKDAIDTLFTELETQVNSKLSSFPDLTGINKGVANSLVASSSGVGLDYSSNFDLFFVGVQFGAAIQSTLSPFSFAKDLASSGSGSLSDTLSKVDGLGAQAALTIGLPVKHITKAKLGFIDFAKMNAYLHFLTYKFDKSIDDVNQINFALNTTSFGAGLQYKILPPVSVGLGVAKWNGLDIQGGLNLSKLGVAVTKKNLNQSVNATSGSISGATANYLGDVSAEVNATTFSIPFEASTSARLLYIFTFFTGLGGDFAVGSSKAAPESAGVISVTSNTVSGVSANGVLDLGANASPGFLNLRYFGGLQLDFTVVGLSIQYSASIINHTKGVTVGAKAYW